MTASVTVTIVILGSIGLVVLLFALRSTLKSVNIRIPGLLRFATKNRRNAGAVPEIRLQRSKFLRSAITGLRGAKIDARDVRARDSPITIQSEFPSNQQEQ
jgi:hypothetical protein